MPNPFFQSLQAGMQQQSGIFALLDQAKQLRNTLQNPKAEVERLLQSGQMSQHQFNQLSQTANQILSTLR